MGFEQSILNQIYDQPVFICGHPKSGTSLVQSMLDFHPQLVVFPEESYFFRKFLPAAQGLDLNQKKALAEEKIIHIFQWEKGSQLESQKGFPDSDYSEISFTEIEVEFNRMTDGRKIKHDGDILSSAIIAFGEITNQLSSQTKYWVEKTPYNEHFADQIYSFWPQAKCIHIVRDPRDNYASYHRKHPDWTPEFFGANWARFVDMGISNQVERGKKNYLILKYEDLVSKVEESLDLILDFLQIEDHQRLRKPSRVGKAWKGNSMFGNDFSEISRKPLGRWHDELTEKDVRVIEWKSRKAMSKVGYQRTFSPTIDVIIMAWVGGIKRRFRYLWRKIKEYSIEETEK